MPITLKELARLAGVSHTSVSLVLRGQHKGRVSDEKREQILTLVRKHGYRPNVAARGLVQRRTYRIALCIYGHLAQHPVLKEFSFHDTVAHAARRIQDAGYALELIDTDVAQRVEETSRALARRSVDAFALVRWPADLAEKVLLSLKEKRIPAAAIGTTLADDGLTWTDVDRRLAMRSAVRLFEAEGRRRIAVLEFGGGVTSEQIQEDIFAPVTRRGGAVHMQRMARSDRCLEGAIRETNTAVDALGGVDGIILTDNFFGDAMVYALKQRGIMPGRDCRVIGLGDTTFADRARPRITHYGLMVADQVDFALDALLDEVKSPQAYRPRHRLFAPSLNRRET